MKKYYSYTKYQNMKTQLESYKDQLPKAEYKVDDARIELDKRVRRVTELIDSINEIEAKLEHIRNDYHIPVRKLHGSARVTNTPLPKSWRTKKND